MGKTQSLKLNCVFVLEREKVIFLDNLNVFLSAIINFNLFELFQMPIFIHEFERLTNISCQKNIRLICE